MEDINQEATNIDYSMQLQYIYDKLDYIDISYPNQPSDVQSILDAWLRYVESAF